MRPCNSAEVRDLKECKHERAQAVVLNIMLDSTHCRSIGVDGHVCELQLTTRGFVESMVRALGSMREPVAA